MATVPAVSPPEGDPGGHQGAAGRPSLGTSGDSATPPPPASEEKRRARRLSRHAVKVTQRAVTSARSSALCWYPSSSAVAIDVGRALTAQVSGVHRCGSGWACPVCAPVVRQRRAEEIDQGVNGWLAGGHGALFVTLTSSHQRWEALEPRLAAMSNALHSLLKGSAWNRTKRRLGYVGSIRAIEVTWGEENGWHPHNHVVLLFDQPVSEEAREALWRWLHDRWSAILLAKGLGSITEAHGVDVRQVTGDVLGEYLAKVDGGWSTGLELARGDVKRSRKGTTPFELLANLAMTGDVISRNLWLEYEAATFGKRWLRWTPGLRALLLGGEVEESDEALAASEGVDLALIRFLVEAEEFRRHVQRGTTGLLLDEVEEAAGWVIVLGDVLGRQWRPIQRSP